MDSSGLDVLLSGPWLDTERTVAQGADYSGRTDLGDEMGDAGGDYSAIWSHLFAVIGEIGWKEVSGSVHCGSLVYATHKLSKL